MWICVKCGERGSRGADDCRACSPEPAGSRILPALPLAVLVGTLALAAVIGGPRLMSSGKPRTERATVRSAAPILEHVPPSLVTVHPRVDDPRAAAVVVMLDTYFTGINERDYEAVATILDPAGDLDPGVPDQLKAFAAGTSTSRDSGIVLLGLSEAAAGRLRAEVAFRSEQKAGHGPPGRPRETCTLWTVVYVLTTGDDGSYRMLRGDGTHRPC
jgi:hypothetical protein